MHRFICSDFLLDSLVKFNVILKVESRKKIFEANNDDILVITTLRMDQLCIKAFDSVCDVLGDFLNLKVCFTTTSLSRASRTFLEVLRKIRHG